MKDGGGRQVVRGDGGRIGGRLVREAVGRNTFDDVAGGRGVVTRAVGSEKLVLGTFRCDRMTGSAKGVATWRVKTSFADAFELAKGG